jgi:hypothetical protein
MLDKGTGNKTWKEKGVGDVKFLKYDTPSDRVTCTFKTSIYCTPYNTSLFFFPTIMQAQGAQPHPRADETRKDHEGHRQPLPGPQNRAVTQCWQ